MAKNVQSNESYYVASQWQLMGRKLKQHKLARISMIILAVLYLGAILGNFIAPYGTIEFDSLYKDCSPTKIHMYHEGEKVGPFVYKLSKISDKKTLRVTISEDTKEYYPIHFFTHGEPYKVLGFIPCDLHLFGVSEGSSGGKGARIYLFGGDSLGRDIFSRVFLGSQV